MSPALGVDPTLRGLLDAIVADGGRGIERFVDVARGQRREEPRFGGVRRPDASEAVGHQFDPDRCAVGAGSTVLLGEDPEQILHVMAVLMSDHVRLREWAALRSEAGLEFLEESEINVEVLVARTVERAGRAAGRSAPRRRGPGEQDRRRLDIRGLRSGQGGRPVRLDAVDVPDDPAIGARVRVGARLAFSGER